jgi:hypothetical protein
MENELETLKQGNLALDFITITAFWQRYPGLVIFKPFHELRLRSLLHLQQKLTELEGKIRKHQEDNNLEALTKALSETIPLVKEYGDNR